MQSILTPKEQEIENLRLKLAELAIQNQKLYDKIESLLATLKLIQSDYDELWKAYNAKSGH